MGSRRPLQKAPIVYESPQVEKALAAVREKWGEVRGAVELLAESGGIDAKREALLLLEKEMDAKRLEYASERDDLLQLAREQAREITDAARFAVSTSETSAAALVEEATRRLASVKERERTVTDREESHARVVSTHAVTVSDYHADVANLRITQSVFANEVEKFEQDRIDFEVRRDEASEILSSIELVRDELDTRKTEVAEILARAVTKQQAAQQEYKRGQALVIQARDETTTIRQRELRADEREQAQEEEQERIIRHRADAMRLLEHVQAIQKRLGLKESQERVRQMLTEMQSAGR